VAKHFPNRGGPEDLALRHEYGKYAAEHGFSAANLQPRFRVFELAHHSEQRAMRHFAAVVDDDELVQYSSMRNARGEGLTWSLLRRLLSLKSRHARLQLAEEAVAHNWSIRKMNLSIRARMPLPTRGAGRSITPPGSPDEAVALLDSAVERVVRVLGVCSSADIPRASEEARTRARNRIDQLRLSLNVLARSLNTAN
jgi:hypothetical protein